MATKFPQEIQFFPQMMDVTANDGALIQQYQDAMQAGNLTLAKQILAQVPNNQSKIITADYLNTINDTVVAVQQYFQQRYSPGYIVDENQPTTQNKNDFWFQVEA
nr:MAG TPA: hypothetical protein [Caudoviricetes sp.]